MGLVYLRSQQLIRFSATGPAQTVSDAAWNSAHDWLVKSGLIGEVGMTYGLAAGDCGLACADCPAAGEVMTYEACIPLAGLIDGQVTQGLPTRRLPGGAYARQRHVGTPDDIASAFSKLCAQWNGQRGLSADATRPRVEVYLEGRFASSNANLKTDLLLPVAACGLSEVHAA